MHPCLLPSSRGPRALALAGALGVLAAVPSARAEDLSARWTRAVQAMHAQALVQDFDAAARQARVAVRLAVAGVEEAPRSSSWFHGAGRADAIEPEEFLGGGTLLQAFGPQGRVPTAGELHRTARDPALRLVRSLEDHVRIEVTRAVFASFEDLGQGMHGTFASLDPSRIGQALQGQGEYTRVDEALRIAVKLCRTHLGKDHPGQVPFLDNLAELAIEKPLRLNDPDFALARRLRHESLRLRGKHLPSGHRERVKGERMVSLLHQRADDHGVSLDDALTLRCARAHAAPETPERVLRMQAQARRIAEAGPAPQPPKPLPDGASPEARKEWLQEVQAHRAATLEYLRSIQGEDGGLPIQEMGQAMQDALAYQKAVARFLNGS